MNRLGKVLHVSNNKNLILRSKSTLPKIGSKVLNKQLKPVGTVFDMFGPISNPYISVKPSVEKPEQYVGEILYVVEKGKAKE